MASSTRSATVTQIAPARLTSASAARYLGYEPQTLVNWRNLGKGPRFHRDGERGSRVFYTVADLNTWIEQRAAKGGGAA